MRLILTSCGLNRKIGKRLIGSKISGESLEEKILLIITIASYGIDECLIQNAEAMGFQRENIYLAKSGVAPEKMLNGKIPQYIYVSEGNAYTILEFMKQNHLIEYIRQYIQDKQVTYVGASAGAMIAGKDIQLAKDFDENQVRLVDTTAIGLFDGTIIPHYTHTEFKRYIRNTDSKILANYKKIFSVGEREVVVLEV